MSNWVYLLWAVGLLFTELVYFRIAERLSIIDRPNDRSSHQTPTIRGAGILFPLAAFVWMGLHGKWPYFLGGLVLIAAISFADDRQPVASWLRAVIQIVAMVLLFYQTGYYTAVWWLLVPAFVIAVGALNAFNFMDGINGITGWYALVNLLTFYFINRSTPFTDASFIAVLMLAAIVFLFFNWRKRARCFAGDVGSVSLAFIQIFMLFQLIYVTGNVWWVGCFVVFGADSVFTIIDRLRKRENIFKAHRQHVFQYLSNELQGDHRIVSFGYALMQLLINALLVYLFYSGHTLGAVVVIAVYLILFFLFRRIVVRKLPTL